MTIYIKSKTKVHGHNYSFSEMRSCSTILHKKYFSTKMFLMAHFKKRTRNSEKRAQYSSPA